MTRLRRGKTVKWDPVCIPKAEGGLGIRKTEMNEVCILKLGWQAAMSISLWGTWCRRRYFSSNSIWSHKNPKVGSCIWKKIRHLSPFIKIGSRWQLGNGCLINVWYDEWLENPIIANDLPHLQFPPEIRLSSMLNGNCWNVPSQLPPKIRAILSQAPQLLSSPSFSSPLLPLHHHHNYHCQSPLASLPSLSSEMGLTFEIQNA